MFKHSTGWDLNARILRLVTDHPEECERAPYMIPGYLAGVVRDEIAQDPELVWC